MHGVEDRMHLLTIHNEGLQIFKDGVPIDEFEFLELTLQLRHTFLISKDINYQDGTFILRFDLDRTQDCPNFTNLYEIV